MIGGGGADEAKLCRSRRLHSMFYVFVARKSNGKNQGLILGFKGSLGVGLLCIKLVGCCT